MRFAAAEAHLGSGEPAHGLLHEAAFDDRASTEQRPHDPRGGVSVPAGTARRATQRRVLIRLVRI